MKSPAAIDYLIIGQGLAGSILAWLLDQHQQRVLIVDRGSANSASSIAAGIVNPVAGQRLVKHPHAEICLSGARSYYSAVGNFFKQPFYFERPMIRLFNAENDRRTWAEKRKNPAYSPYLNDGFNSRQGCHVPANQFGGFHQTNCGYLDTRRFLAVLKKYFKSKKCLVEAYFSWDQFSLEQPQLAWNGLRIGQIIACDGFYAGCNRYFSWLPFQLSKGEILTLESNTDLSDTIISKGKWVLPLSKKVLRSGSTYQWNPLDTLPSAPARETLGSTARQLVRQNTELHLLSQEAGIRAGTRDKNPFAGIHPSFPRLGIFNGFGSRGVLTIPHYAERFVQTLLQQAPLPKEVDIARYL